MLTVRDNGCGMDRDTLDHVFEPFFTTKGAGNGTGMGLATVFGIVKQAGGEIEVSSQPGKGTDIHTVLSALRGRSRRLAKRDRRDISPRPGDHSVGRGRESPSASQPVRFSMVSVTRHRGSRDPAEALKLAADPSRAIDLLITDVVMPGMNGRVLAERLMSERPNMRCLYISGYPADALARRGVMTEDVEFLPKPFTKDALARKVRQVLDKR